MAEILQTYEVTNGYLKLKFIDTILLSSFTTATLTLETDEATPVEISNPIDDWTVAENYNSIARLLTIYWNDGVLEPNTSYTFTISGLYDVANLALDDGVIHFETDDSVEPNDDELEPPAPEPVEVIDYSIVTDISFFDESASLDEEDPFAVSESDPADGSFYVDNDHNNGRVTITFNKRPALEYVTTQYIRAYRKIVQRTPIRWEAVDIHVALDSQDPIVTVDFPDIDDGEYYTFGKDYFEDGYKYKITISKDLST